MGKRGSFPAPRSERLEADISRMSEFVDRSEEGWTRPAFTKVYNEGRRWLSTQMVAAGLRTRMDAAANLIGRIEGVDPSLPPIVLGSHTDTVRNGGRFDGVIGVLAGVEIARLVRDSGIRLRHPLEIIDFTAEEPTEFGISTIGSKALAGNLTAEMLDLRDPEGRSLAEAVESAGGNPGEILSARRMPGDIASYFELHIEQGPVLEESRKELGVVTGIVGILRLLLTLTGSPDHSGTTPMGLRRDSLAGAAEMLLLLEELCSQPSRASLVGTVGRISVSPNAPNVIAGETLLNVEIRSTDADLMESTAETFLEGCRRTAESRRLGFEPRRMSFTAPVRINERMIETVRKACAAVGGRHTDLVSGAGHDANQMACIAPVGMIFVPSKGGRSHCPEEYTDIRHIRAGAAALLRCVTLFDDNEEITS